ncbi:pro-FMRFamide-related neuropeptide VF isoform 1-T1 [Acanthopagrus schlegelii]
MLTAVFLSALLMLWVSGGAEASDLRVSGKSIHTDKSLSDSDGRHSVRKQLHLYQAKSDIGRSLDPESLKVQLTPTSRSKFSLPSIIKLYPPTSPPLNMHHNMPMRFGRNSDYDDEEGVPESSPNMPQRFGRAWEVFEMCAECPGVEEALQPLPRPWRRSLYWSLLRTLARTTYSLPAGLKILTLQPAQRWRRKKKPLQDEGGLERTTLKCIIAWKL